MDFTLTMNVKVNTDSPEKADELINKMLDRLGNVPTEDLGISWDDLYWDEVIYADEETN